MQNFILNKENNAMNLEKILLRDIRLIAYICWMWDSTFFVLKITIMNNLWESIVSSGSGMKYSKILIIFSFFSNQFCSFSIFNLKLNNMEHYDRFWFSMNECTKSSEL